ncbi:hypothetical protein CCR75_007768 [Bremia lactucae]|uniref:Uncharacterized protein n=1 Tax=Bremia lactucae TaxID=4779 RepID=A0A976II85_BRELC|nr:hypothetical protein CCR75_007768 [Bremia lactucae]
MAEGGALLHSCAVYLYLYDESNGSYAQQTDAAVGCALLGGEHAAESNSDAFSLLLYDTQKAPLLQLPVTPSARFVPQKDHYVNFYERKTQRNYAMRFKDAIACEKFMIAVSCAKAQVLVQASKSYERQKPAILFDQVAIGMADAIPLTFGDVAGVMLRKWQGSMEQRASFFSANPLDIMNQEPTEATNEVQRIKLQKDNGEMDAFTQILASEALVGMQKRGKRFVTVTFPDTHEWVIAVLELVKVKKNVPNSNTAAMDAEKEHGDREELVQRMASLSRMGSQTSGLLASVKTHRDTRASAGHSSENHTLFQPRTTSFGHQDGDPRAGSVPVLLAGLQLPGDRRRSLRNIANEHEVTTEAQNDEIERMNDRRKVMSLSSDMDRLMKEQSDIVRLREELEEKKRKLESEGTKARASESFSDSSLSVTAYKPVQEEPVLSFLPSPFAVSGASGSTWKPPPSLGSVPSPAFPPAHSTFSSSMTPYPNRSFVSFPSPPGVSRFESSLDVEAGISRLQRSSTSIESTLMDLQSKIDRFLNSHNGTKATKFLSSYTKSSGNASFSHASTTASSSSMLLKNVEKALVQRDELQNLTSRLQEANEELESSIEELQSQQEALQMENRTLLDKLQNGNYLQQEKFRLEMRGVQQQLSHTQEQVLVCQEENFQLRAQLSAKDDQMTKLKAKFQDDMQKQLTQLQQQVKSEARQNSTEFVERISSEKAALEAQVVEFAARQKQWEVEREKMTHRLSQAQNQQELLQDETVKTQAAQASRVQELLSQIQQLEGEHQTLKHQVEEFRSKALQFEESLASKEHEMAQLQSARNDQEYTALSELFKEFMNDIYFHFQDAFEEETEFTGKEIVMAIRKILKQNTMAILAKLEEFYEQQALQRQGR